MNSTTILVRKLKAPYWQVEEDFFYRGFHIKKGFVTDFASVPKWLWSFIPPFQDDYAAFIVHDWIYRELNDTYTKKDADIMMRDIMEVKGANYFRRNLAYLAVRFHPRARRLWNMYSKK